VFAAVVKKKLAAASPWEKVAHWLSNRFLWGGLIFPAP
jgi:hypothetical protein